MIMGIPKEIKSEENRVAIVPLPGKWILFTQSKRFQRNIAYLKKEEGGVNFL